MHKAKEEAYTKMANWLERRYVQYGSGILYLRRLAGLVARPASALPPLQWLSPSMVQQAVPGRVELEEPLDVDVHDLRVCFCRL